MTVILISIGVALLSLVAAGLLALSVIRQGSKNHITEAMAVHIPTMQAISQAIQEGATAFLRREYKVLFVFVAIVAVIIGLLIDYRTAIAYLAGAMISALTGFLGMHMAVRANWRTTANAIKGLNSALRVAFSGGAVMGFMVVGLGLLGVTVLYLVLKDINLVVGFSFGASTIALFARVGGGIFTKAADVGADLVGKVEVGIPEDDPRNPAVIADNVGDNVGDVAGMGADLFESFVGAIIAAIAIGSATAMVTNFDSAYAILPLLIASAGIVASILGTFLVRAGEEATFSALLWALRRGIFVAAALVVVFSIGAVWWLDVSFNIFWAILVGLLAGIAIGISTEYYTSYEYGPTRSVAAQTQTGPATTIIIGLATGMQSVAIPVAAVAIAVVVAFILGDGIGEGMGFYGVAIAAVGMLSTLGITLATDAYGPIADNAGGIAEQAKLPPEIRQRTDSLDALGNTTAATGKGFAIGSAALTALALMAAYANAVDVKVISLLDYRTLVGLLIGASLPFLFSAMTMKAVGRAAFAIVNEVRRQFREIPGIMESTAKPDYARCVDISTSGSLKEMIMPGAMAVLAPLAVGFVLGKEALGGLLIGAIATGFLLAITMSNAGGSWDNAKKYIEAGNLGGKGSDAHKAGVVGDTVGDPFKDTSGPSLNILLKLMSVVALVFAPVFLKFTPLIGS